jgi:diguanylate cyclase (GGDEF)-like protein
MDDRPDDCATRFLIVDDSSPDRLLLEAFQILGLSQPGAGEPLPDLILMDQSLGESDGIEACRAIKAVERLAAIPIVMVTGTIEGDVLKRAFEAGVADYVAKPARWAEFLARVRAVLRVQRERDMRASHEQKLKDLAWYLEASNQELLRVASLDTLTTLPDRRRFAQALGQEWRRAMREASPISVVLVDLDAFAVYNERHGTSVGDQCLKRVSGLLSRRVRRAGDLVARWGDDTFAVLLPATHAEGAFCVAQALCAEVGAMEPPAQAEGAGRMTACAGVATAVPARASEAATVLEAAQAALAQAQQEGPGRVKACVPVAAPLKI